MPDGIEALLASSDHIPFNGHPGLDCGLAGDELDVDRLEADLPDDVDAQLAGTTLSLENAYLRAGWIRDPDDQVDCIVVVDEDGTVVGAGVIGPRQDGFETAMAMPPGTDGFLTVQPRDADEARPYLVLTDGGLAPLFAPRDLVNF